MANIDRDKKIYADYLKGSFESDLSKKYSLKPNTITKILKKYSKKHQDLDKYLCGLYRYVITVAMRPMGIATRIKNSLRRYSKSYNIFDIDELMKLVLDDSVYIRGIGVKSREIIKEYYKNKDEFPYTK